MVYYHAATGKALYPIRCGSRPGRINHIVGISESSDVKYENMPQSAKLRIIWNAVSKQWRVFYGLNGDEPTSELSRSKQGFYVQQPMGQSTAVHIMVGHGSADIDRFEIRPL